MSESGYASAPQPSPSPPERRKRGPRRYGMSLLAALFVYLNLAAINAQFAANFARVPALPVIDLLADPFFLFGMFNGYPREVSELSVQGLRAGTWQPLSASEFFPGPAREFPLWAQASRSVGELLPAAVIAKERARFLERIRQRHNTLHPAARVERVRVGFLSWPKSRIGREALRVPGQETFSLAYEQ